MLEGYGQKQGEEPGFKLKNDLEQQFLQLHSYLNNLSQIQIALPGNDVKILLAKFIKKVLHGLIDGKGFEHSAPEAETLLHKKPDFTKDVNGLSVNYELSYRYLLTLTEFALKLNNTVTGWGAWMRSFITYWISDRSGIIYYMYNQKFLWLNSNSNLNPLETEANKLLMASLTVWLEKGCNPFFINAKYENPTEQAEFKVRLLEFCLFLTKQNHAKTAAQNENPPASDTICIQNSLDISSTTIILQDCFPTASDILLPIIFSYLPGNKESLNQNFSSYFVQDQKREVGRGHCAAAHKYQSK